MEDYLKLLNEKQLEAVLHQGSPLLILAGAGSGKTRVITTKIAHLIDTHGMDPRSILAVTFTNKAAREMYDRVLGMTSSGSGVMIRTFHSFGAWLLRRNAQSAGLHPSFTIYDEEDTVSLLHSLNPGVKRADMKPYAVGISRAKDYALGPGDDLSPISLQDDISSMYQQYQERLEEIGSVDFGDLILKSVNLLKENREIRARIQQRFSVVLVDEYQDSNVAQFELLKQLKGEETYLCVVGDDDQSIYRFRGAEVRNIIDFPDYFPGTVIIRLEQNYRSTEKILAIASAVVENNTGRLGKTLWTDKKGGKKGVFKLLEDHTAEAAYCAELLSDGNLEDTAILYRTNAQSLPFESLFVQCGIPYRIVGALRFYEREEIKDALAFLNFLLNPKDEIAFLRIINKPARGLGKVKLGNILEEAEYTGGDLAAACRNTMFRLTGRAGEGLKEFMAAYDRAVSSLGTTSLPEMIRQGISDLGFIEYHKKQDEIAGTQKLLNLEELVSATADYTGDMEGLTLFVEHLELDRSMLAGEEEDGAERVTLITMHNTKGLEFRRVIITGLEDGLFPSIRDGSEEDIEEERRIFYVSITRAKEELYLTSCRQRRIWGRLMPFMPSRFLDEIPGELLSATPRSGGQGGGAYTSGTRIYHDDYGYGVVTQSMIREGEEVLIVRFDTGHSARFLPRFTPIMKAE